MMHTFFPLLLVLILPFLTSAHAQIKENEKAATTITDEDFQILVKLREEGLAGFHQNIDSNTVIPAPESALVNWSDLSHEEKERLILKQETMFREGKIALIVMAGGEATRFGGPKTFVTVSEKLGEFLEIKAANLRWLRHRYRSKVPLYILSSEKRLEEFQTALALRNFYGLSSDDFRWYVQGTVDTFIPSNAELKAQFSGAELQRQLLFANNLRQTNPDGIYRFKGERRKVPEGHFDAIASFVISGLFTEALTNGIQFASIVNIDNLVALLKNDGMIAYFAEKNFDFGFLLAEKNFTFSLFDKITGSAVATNLIVRFRDGILSFDGNEEFYGHAEREGLLYRLNPERKTIDVYKVATGEKLETVAKVKVEIGGTLVQPIDQQGKAKGAPILKEGFELPSDFPHANAPFFNTNTMILHLPALLKFLDVSEKELAEMTFEERSRLVHEKWVSKMKIYFEFKNHEVEGEYPYLGIVKEGKTKILVSQATRLMLQATHFKGAHCGYLFAPRSSVFAPVKEPEDKQPAADRCLETIQQFTLYSPCR